MLIKHTLLTNMDGIRKQGRVTWPFIIAEQALALEW